MSRAREAEDGFDDFGPRQGNLVPPPCRVDDNGSLAVVADGVVIGGVGWRWAQWGPSAGSRCPMIGIYLEPSARGRGDGTRAQQLVVELLFRHTATNRIEAHTDVENIAEQRALERAGLTREGVVRGAQWRDGAYRDGYLYSVLRAEWQALSAG
jgi:RimJ/RimL family protein N-acetyltransferase